MAATGDPIDQLSRAIDQTEAIISRISPDQATLPTPCSDWDVGALVEHVVEDLKRFTARASRGEQEPVDPAAVGEDWTGAYREASDKLLAAWRREGALEGTVKLPFGEFPPTWFVGQAIADLVVHGWDLAVATGQSTELDPELGRQALDWGRENLRPEFRGRDFGAEVTAPAEAPVHDRLAAFFGRDPNWARPRAVS
jgi:uncharacterized protein (TIGR03086 family)